MTISHHMNPFVIAQALDVVSTTKLLDLGTRVMTNDGGSAVYCQALSGVAQYNGVVLSAGYTALALSTTSLAEGSGQGVEIGWAQVSAASGSYLWIQTSGRPKGKVAQACADKVSLFSTATAGVMDDTVVSAGYIEGVYLKTTTSTASALTLLVAAGAQRTHYQGAA